MNVFVAMINLERAADRRSLMQEELAKAGIQASFTPCFDWKAQGQERLADYCVNQNAWDEFYIGNMATTTSHSFAWEAFLASDKRWCLVLEDDVHISRDVSGWLKDMSWWPQDADIVKLERWIDDRALVLLDQKASAFAGRKIRRMRSRYMGAAGYMLTRPAAQRLLAMRPFNMVIDHLLFNVNYSTFARNAVIYQVVPALIRQGNEPLEKVVYQSVRSSSKTGWPKLKQRLRRAALEFALPLKSYASWLSGRARLCKVDFLDDSRQQRP